MPKFVPLSREQHAGQGWKGSKDYVFARHDTMVPVVMQEVSLLLQSMVLAFVPDKQSGAYQLVAIQSVPPGSNVYVRPSGEWLAGQVPALYRAWPFRMARQGRDQLVFTVCEDSGLIVDAASEVNAVPFFDAQGEMSEPLSKVAKFLQQYERYRKMTRKAVDQLVAHDMLESWEPSVETPNGEKKRLTGLYAASEARLREAQPDVLAELAQSGALGLAYGQYYSKQRIRDLPRLMRIQQRLEEKATAGMNLDDMFGPEGGDELSFDFSVE